MHEVVQVLIVRLREASLQVKRNSPTNRRNQLIRQLYASGMSQTKIGARFGITPVRVSQIVNYKR